jgi:hypothetical protein
MFSFFVLPFSAFQGQGLIIVSDSPNLKVRKYENSRQSAVDSRQYISRLARLMGEWLLIF